MVIRPFGLPLPPRLILLTGFIPIRLAGLCRRGPQNGGQGEIAVADNTRTHVGSALHTGTVDVLLSAEGLIMDGAFGALVDEGTGVLVEWPPVRS